MRRTDGQQVLGSHGSWAILPVVALLLQAMPPPGGKPGPVQPASIPIVILKTDKALYGVHEPVTVVIANVSRSPVTMYSGGFSCTVVRLERRTPQGWTGLENCLRVSVPIPEVLGPGAKRTLTFALGSEPGAAEGFPRGTFRFVVIFEVNAQKDGGARGFVAYSDPFTVR